MTEIIVGPTHDPHALLGAHPADDGTVIRTLRRGAGDVVAIVDGVRHPMQKLVDEGIFEVTVPGPVSERTPSPSRPRDLEEIDQHIGNVRHQAGTDVRDLQANILARPVKV